MRAASGRGNYLRCADGGAPTSHGQNHETVAARRGCPGRYLADRRLAFVEWLTSPTNPFFARVAVNRIWADVMGQGIVEAVDDFRQSNPPAIPALLDKLAEDFVRHGYDQRYILRTILASRVYQLSSHTTKFNQDDTRLFSHANLRHVSRRAAARCDLSSDAG